MGIMFIVLGAILLKLKLQPHFNAEDFYKRYSTKKISILVWILSILFFLSAAICFFCIYDIAVRYDISGIIEELFGWR